MTIEFLPSGRGKAQCEPDPLYPNGIALDATTPETSAWCMATLPYPAPECGMWRVSCDVCVQNVFITAAGRVDDPVSVRLPCRISGHVSEVRS